MASYSVILSTDADASLAVSNSAVSLTLPAEFAVTSRQTKGSGGGRVTIQVRTAPVLYTLNSTAPTAADESTGTKLNVGDLLILTTFAEMDNVKFIRATSADGALFYYFSRRVN